MTLPQGPRTVPAFCAKAARERAKKLLAGQMVVPNFRAVHECAEAARDASEVTERHYVENQRRQLECPN